MKPERKRLNRQIWIAIGAVILILLLLLWLYIAFLGGDTDVVAAVNNQVLPIA